jgi:hypothetical protein
VNATLCPREDELLDALGRGLVGPELSAHVAGCGSCSELRVVAGAVLEDRREAIAAAPLPSSGTMLWRMKMRHHQEAQAAARRSLLIGQAATLAVAITLLVALFGTNLAFEAREVIAAIRVSTPLLFTLATWVLVAPIAGYVAMRQK